MFLVLVGVILGAAASKTSPQVRSNDLGSLDWTECLETDRSGSPAADDRVARAARTFLTHWDSPARETR